MRIILLGTGDATGTPKIGCRCNTCSYAPESRKQRLRTSLLVEVNGHNILVDTSPDLRLQLLCRGSPHIDGVIWTHGHYDHFAGYGEFYRIQKMPPAYAAPSVMRYIAEQLHFLPLKRCPKKPFEPFDLFGITFTLCPVNHPPIDAYGVVMEHNGIKIAYTGDTKYDIPEESLDLMGDCDLLFVDAIVPGGIKIGKHMNYEEACRLAGELRARDFRCVHMSHLIPWDHPHIGMDGEEFVF